jgi:hypothetical protein
MAGAPYNQSNICAGDAGIPVCVTHATRTQTLLTVSACI